MKTCNRCDVHKDVTEFHNDKSRPDGLYPYCKDCRRNYYGYSKRVRVDLTGKQFGKLTVVRSVKPSLWLCRCECGNEALAWIGDLQRQDKSAHRSCGKGKCRWKAENPSYGAVHGRKTSVSGPAKHYACINECGNMAAQWAYNHADANEQWETNGGYFIPYSTDLNNYVPLCVPCHKTLDAGYLQDQTWHLAVTN